MKPVEGGGGVPGPQRVAAHSLHVQTMSYRLGTRPARYPDAAQPLTLILRRRCRPRLKVGDGARAAAMVTSGRARGRKQAQDMHQRHPQDVSGACARAVGAAVVANEGREWREGAGQDGRLGTEVEPSKCPTHLLHHDSAESVAGGASETLGMESTTQKTVSH